MAEITALHVTILAGSIAAGAVIGWFVCRSRRSQEKIAINEGWQKQLEAQRAEHARLVEQNKGLMEQVSQLRASGKDATNRARELSGALKESFERRDELQRELKETRSTLETAVRQCDKLKSDIIEMSTRGDSIQEELKRRDDKVVRLSRELENWQNRLPPLLDRYRERDVEAARIAEKLRAADERIAELENRFDADETRAESSGPDKLGKELDASNDPEAPGQVASGDATAHDPEEEHSLSGIVSEAGADGDEDSEAAAEAGDETSFAPHIGDDDIDGEISDIEPEYVEADEVISDDEYASSSDEPDEPFDGDDIAAAAKLADEIIDDDDELGETELSDEEESLTGAAEDAGDWRSATSAEITRLEGHGPSAGRDDLQLIKGIGPAIAKTLNELGIFRFDQIADMSEYDIERVARRLRGFRSRIYREDWIGQARDLQLQKTAN